MTSILLLLRCLPYGLSMVTANLIHYSSLWTAREAAARRVKARQRLRLESYRYEHQPLTFNLMSSPEMRRARYKIKLFRYSITLIHLLIFHNHLQELHPSADYRLLSWITVQVLIVGMLTGLITIYLDENHDQQMRTLWNPAADFSSNRLGIAWDCLRVMGGCFAVPIEEELFYHSWLYRHLFRLLNCCFQSFADVPLRNWSWSLSLATNAFIALYNGKEWRSCFLCGFLFQWMISSRGELLDGILAHFICNLTINSWVLISGQRQFW